MFAILDSFRFRERIVLYMAIVVLEIWACAVGVAIVA